MNELINKVFEELRGAWRFRWIALIVAWAVCIAGWPYVFSRPDIYFASARVFVDSRTALRPVLEGMTIEQDVDAQINLVRQSLFGGPQLERVGREAGYFKEPVSDAAKSRATEKLRSQVELEVYRGGERGGGAVYVLGARDEDRGRALKVVELLLATFVEETLGGKRAGSEAAQRFLRQQIAETEKRLSAAEQRLADFKKKYVAVMPGAQGDYFSRLQGEMEAAKAAEARLSIAQTRREELLRQLRGDSQSNTPATARTVIPTSDEMGGRIKETQAKLDDLLLRFTEKHPDVVALREILEQLRARQAEELSALRRGDPAALASAGASANPIYQSIQLSLNQTEVEIAALKAEISDRQGKVANLRTLVDTVPEVEAEFARLNRDYDVVRAQYTSFVDRLERARLGEEAEAAESIKFEVIDPPAAGFRPIAPDRPRLLSLVLLAALAMGAGAAYLMHQFRPVFTGSRMLAEITGLPVLGAVSLVTAAKFRAAARRGYVWFSLGIVALVLCFAIVVQFESAGVRAVRQLIT